VMTEGSPGEIIGRNVRTAREAKLFSRTDLAQRSGLSVPGLEHLERGLSTRPRRSTVEKIAKALEIPLDELLTPPEGWGLPPEEIARLEPVMRDEHGLTLLAMSTAEFDERLGTAVTPQQVREISDSLEAEWRSLEPLRERRNTSGETAKLVTLALQRMSGRWDQAEEKWLQARRRELQLPEAV
jgi:transcriptional regulator with XRE-family HTH domain